MSNRPSFQGAQRFLIIGILAGVILGCTFGLLASYVYVVQNPPVYQGGAFPNELTNAYQNHYLAMTVDSYIVNQEPEVAAERLKTFDQATQIRVLGERSAAYVSAGRGVEAQLINNLAISLKNSEGWNEDTIKSVVADLTSEYQSDPAKAQAISTFSAQLLDGQVPVPADATGEAAQAPDTQAPPPPAAAQPSLFEGTPWFSLLLCCLALIIVALVLYILYRRLQGQKEPPKSEVAWEGEGKPPLKQWSGTYTLGDDNYDEFFTIETEEGDFLGESGVGIMDSVPGTSPKQVLSFDVGLFDKTDITTLSRVVMSEHAFNDQDLRAKVEANPQAEAILAEPGKKFSFETTAMRVEAEIEEVEYGEDNKYFTRFKSNLNVFLKEGADIKRGEMDIPDQFR